MNGCIEGISSEHWKALLAVDPGSTSPAINALIVLLERLLDLMTKLVTLDMFLHDKFGCMIIIVNGLCTHNSVQPVLVKKGPCGTLQCHNPYKRSESFLLLSKTYQTFHYSRFCSKEQVLPLMIFKTSTVYITC